VQKLEAVELAGRIRRQDLTENQARFEQAWLTSEKASANSLCLDELPTPPERLGSTEGEKSIIRIGTSRVLRRGECRGVFAATQKPTYDTGRRFRVALA
jgi:hypothetical protein